MKKILFTGRSGLVGSRVFELLENKYQFLSLSREEKDGFITIDLTSENLKKTLLDLDFEYIFHFAGYTAVDEAEKQRDDKGGPCYKLNVDATSDLARIAKEKNAKMIYISTDFVFEGTNGPYSEDNPTGEPENLTWYGWTKKLGEEAVLNSGEESLVVRISYPFRSSFEKSDFARDIISKIQSNTLYPLFNDQFITPTFIDNLANFLDTSLTGDLSGIFHVACADIITPYQFGQMINDIFGFNYHISKSSIKKYQNDFPDKAKRPQNGGLRVSKLDSINFPTLSNQQAVEILKKQIDSKSDKIS